MNKGKATANMMALQGVIFNLEFQITYKLQDIGCWDLRDIRDAFF